MKIKKKVLEPLRFVEAHYDFSPIQRDFLMMVQYKTDKQSKIKSDFKINLKPYFKSKGISLANVRLNHYKDICNDLMATKVGFQYFKGSTLYRYFNIFSSCSVDEDFVLSVSIIDDVLPLFYINKLNEGHFKENKLIKELFENSYPEHDNYVSYYPKTFIDFEESSTKKLFQRLLQYKYRKNHTYEFTKNEMYLLLGYGYFVEKEIADGQQNIFDIKEMEFKQVKYAGVAGWKNFAKQLNKWLKIISDHKGSFMTIKQIGGEGKYYKTKGRPIRNIIIEVDFDDDLDKYSDDELEAYEILKPFGLTSNQVEKIINTFPLKIIKKILQENIVKKRDKDTLYYGEYKRSDHRRIENIGGFVYNLFKVNEKDLNI